MNGVVLLLALATPTVDYGWRMADGGSVECIVQVEPALLSAMVDGETKHASARDNGPQSARKRFLLQIGSEQLPRETVQDAAVRPATYGAAAQDSFPNASLVRYGWRALDNGEVECLLRIDPRLARAVLEGRASPKLVGGEMPSTDRPIQFVVQVDDRALPADAVAAADLIRRVAFTDNRQPTAPRSVELSTAGGDIDTVRTVFETQLQLRRGGADSQFETREELSPRTTSLIDNWNNRAGAATGSVGDAPGTRFADSRFGARGESSTLSPATLNPAAPSRYGGAPPLESPRGDEGGLRIRYGDTATQPPPARGLTGQPAAGSQVAPSRYQPATTPPYTPVAPPLDPSSYAAERQRATARPPMAPIRQPAAQPGYAPRGSVQPPPYASGHDPQTGYRDPYYPPVQAAAPAGAVGNSERLAARGQYAGPFQGGTGANSGAAINAKPEAAAADDKALEPAEKTAAEPELGAWVMVVVLLLISLVGNAYLGHTGWVLYRRYRALTNDMRASSVASSYADGATEPSTSGRRQRDRLAARY